MKTLTQTNYQASYITYYSESNPLQYKLSFVN